MRAYFTCLASIFLAFGPLSAQTPEAFNYQGVARDAGGDALANTAIGVQFQLHQGTAVGTVVYSETHSPTTNELGLFSLEVGNGSPGTGTFAAIDWSAGPYFLEVGLDPAGGSSYTSVGTQQLLSVPYALHAKTADMADDGDWVLSGDTVHSNGRRVGIGTTAPTHRLNVKGNGQGFSQNSANDNVRVGTYTDNNNAYIQTHSDHPLHFATNNALAQVSLLQNGDLGIGTTTPEARLDVAGSFKLNDGSQGDKKILTSDADGNASWEELSAEVLFGSGNVPSGTPACPTLVAEVTAGNCPRAIAVSGNFAYVLNYNDNNMMVFDITAPANGDIPIATIATGTDPSSVAVSGNYAYVLNQVDANMMVFDITEPANGDVPIATIATGNGPISVAVSGNYAFVLNYVSNNMMVFDISDPDAPSQSAETTTGLLSFPSSISVSGNYAYVACNFTNEMKVFDITDPNNIDVEIAAISTGLNPISVVVSGNYAYVVNYTDNNMNVFEISTPASPSLIATIATGSAPASVAVSGNYAYVVNQGDDNMMVFDITAPTNADVPIATIATGDIPNAAAVIGNRAFVPVCTGGFKVFELACPIAAQQVVYDPVSGEFGSAAPIWQLDGDTISSSTSHRIQANTGAFNLWGAAPLGAGTRLVFGDDYFSSTGTVNTFIGEAGWENGLDSDELQLHGKTGIALTYGAGVAGDPIKPGLVLFNSGTVGVGMSTSVDYKFTAQTNGVGLAQLSNDGNIALGTYADDTYGAFLQTHTAHPLNFSTNNGAAQMTLLQNGNVGIGTTAPNALLDVRGNARVGSADGVTNASLTITTGANSGGGQSILEMVAAGSGCFATGALVLEKDAAAGTSASRLNFMLRSDDCGALQQRMTLRYNGNVGIGTDAPTAKLSVNGTANNSTGSWGVFSDARIKTVQREFTDGLSVIDRLRPIVFTYNADAPFDAEGEQVGIIAQELEAIAPYMVSITEHGDIDDLREVSNQAYVFLLINAVKEQQRMIEELQASNVEKENRIDLLHAQVEANSTLMRELQSILEIRTKR